MGSDFYSYDQESRCKTSCTTIYKLGAKWRFEKNGRWMKLRKTKMVSTLELVSQHSLMMTIWSKNLLHTDTPDPSTHTRWGTHTHGKAHFYEIWLEHYWSTDGQADHFFSHGLATLELAMSVGWSVDRSVGLWVTKTKSEHFVAIPLLPTRPLLRRSV